MIAFRVFFTAIGLMGSLYSTYAQGSLQQEMDAALRNSFGGDEPGAVVLVWEKGKLLYERGIGLASLESKQPIGPATTFRMASVSKQFTAVAVLMLEKQGKLGLADKLSKYFPKFRPELGDRITLKHLLTHTSGIPDYEGLLDTTWKRQLMDEDIPALLESQPTGYFPPGARFQYSNTGFCLLALVVQLVSGESYGEFMERTIFGPLGMKQTFIYDSQHPMAGRGMGYARTKQGNWIASDQSTTSATKGDGCVYTSAFDYLTWYEAIRTNRLVKFQDRLAEIGFLLPSGAMEGYGLGWFFRKSCPAGCYEMTHTGSTSGFSNVVIQVPETDLLILYFSNIAENHAPFAAIQAVIRKYASHSWQVDWNAMHRLTD